MTPDGAPRPLLLLVGLMGVGKTTVGRRVADRLGWVFVDDDERFQGRTGTTAAAYATGHGDRAMHEIEWELLAGVLDGPAPAVVALPGSVVDAPGVDLGGAFVVWLTAAPEVVAGRLGRAHHRPLLGDAPAASLACQLEERSGRYRRLADLTVDAPAATPDEVADRVVDAWCRRAGHR